MRFAAIVFIVFLLAGFALAFSVYQNYTALAEQNSRIKTHFTAWEAAMAPRVTMLRDLAEITEPYDHRATQAQDEADRILAEAPGGSGPQARIAMYTILENALASLHGLAIRYPQLRESDLFREWETGYLRNQIAADGARTGYNSAVRAYNNILDSFSGKLIALLFTVPPKPLIPE